MRFNYEAFCGLEVRYNVCAITLVCVWNRNACLLLQNATRREWRAAPAVWESVVSLLQQDPVCTRR